MTKTMLTQCAEGKHAGQSRLKALLTYIQKRLENPTYWIWHNVQGSAGTHYFLRVFSPVEALEQANIGAKPAHMNKPLYHKNGKLWTPNMLAYSLCGQETPIRAIGELLVTLVEGKIH